MAVNDSYTGLFGAQLVVTKAAGVLANDTLAGGGTLTVVGVNDTVGNTGQAVAGRYGSLVLAADGSFTYSPDATKAPASGSVTDHFTYREQGNGLGAIASVDIVLSPQGGGMGTGTGAPQLANQPLFGTIEHSTTSPAAGVYALYEALLGRVPDALGLEAFAGAVQGGTSLTSVASALLASPERGAPVTDPTAYVQGLYTNLLHRTADSGGLTNFTNELNAGVSQAAVAVQIATSQEAQNVNASTFSTGVFVADASEASVARLYYGLLGRAPDAGGLQALSAFVENGGGGAAGEAARLDQTAAAIINSPEYASTHSNGTALAFVNGLYAGALGRAPDAGGQTFYLDQLAHGVSRATVALEIAESPEAQIHLVGVIEQGFHLAG
ncbi:DUF4214 domain-containing protein [Methylobacterium sp. WL12]|uniref:DUF4214 domain-containing protein n=1 Tax=Methylobacterium sp. WL12 TaxID=2603890 RepID=UPI001FEF1EFA|nr:DUF4214 domain-containing protein [Methylobacterium sp. WL12]